MKVVIAVVFSALVLAGCAAEPATPVAESSSNNPLETQCRAEGVKSGPDMATCMRRHAAAGIARDTCERKGLRKASAPMDQCVKYEAQFIEATQQCLSGGVSASDGPLLKSCIAGKAPEAAAYKGIKAGG
ncbi:hypothetical protein [Labrys monachus]|uniref:Uncharacterized protein n=1 Tax=Labrys monachus TaxID=217067 RepID=A0ABU0FCQ7_9HYPH|nr:hypothetical protein [Labrys monachus]MDQ0392380.1 hypothetical protein [Labrys monachus]